MTHGEQMAILGKINALYEVALDIQNKIHELNKQLKEAEDGSNKASTNRSRWYGL